MRLLLHHQPPQSFGQLPQQVEGADKLVPSHQLAGGGARRAEGDSTLGYQT